MLTWLPYSISSMYIAFVDEIGLGPMAETLPAMFAKSSMVWSTIFYIYSNKDIKSKISFRLFRVIQHATVESDSSMNRSLKLSLRLRRFTVV